MARVGKAFDAPSTGEKFVVLQLGDDARGVPVRLDATIAAHAGGPPEHIHPSTEETFEVLSGTLSLRVAGKSHVLGPGEKLMIPPGTPHRFWNEGDDEVRAYIQSLPGQRWLNFLEAMYPVVGHGRINPLRLAAVLREYLDETYSPHAPLPVQKAILGVLASAGRLLGYHPARKTQT